ncbi:MAG: hypothetical protein NC124_10755 [Clostridium sp.]|nr:hypothetical protein [Clostridium sp.]
MYNYPFPNKDNYFDPIEILAAEHSMGNSLYGYLKLKVHPLLKSESIKNINIIGYFNRNNNISSIEKGNKLFNYMRPTVTLDGKNAELDCFPGIDYIFHFSNIIKSYMCMYNKNISIRSQLPTEIECWQALEDSTLKNIPRVDTVIMGYVEGLEFLSEDKCWQGNGNFLYKSIRIKSGKAILLGCKHTFWGEIAGRIVTYLSELGIKRIIYSGKLGTLVDEFTPNEVIATGNSSILPNGEIIRWNNVFDDITCNKVKRGIHITVPSVLQETNEWVSKNKSKVSFIDPEIGHMAYAAQKAGVEYSYLHIVSDNLAVKYPYDLSNERRTEVLRNRVALLSIIGNAIMGI